MRLSRSIHLLVALVFPALLAAQIQQEDVSLTMDDGVVLDATFFRPGSAAPDSGFPCVILVHGLGGKKEHVFDAARFLVIRGYAAFAYSVRGQGNSGGLRTFSGEREREDMKAIIRWLSDRPDVNGARIAVVGGSQGGQHAWWSALYNLGVRTVVPIAGYIGDLTSNGCVETAVLEVITSSRVRYGPMWQRVVDWILDDQFDSLKAVLPDPDELVTGVKMPVFLSLAYRDCLFAVNEGIRQFELLPGPKWLHLGTGYHGAEEVDTVTLTLLQLVFDWLDRYLKGSVRPDTVQQRVIYHVDETWESRTVQTWPPEDAVPVTFYLTADGRLSEVPPSGEVRLVLRQRLLDPGYSPRQAFDDGFGATTVAKFGYDQLSFVTPPFVRNVEWAGSPSCSFRVLWSGPKMQLHVQFYDVDAEGNWHFLQRGNVALRSGARDTLLEFSAQAYAHVFAAGHRLGVRLTPLDFVAEEGVCYAVPFFTDFSDTLVGSLGAPLSVSMPLRGGLPSAIAERTSRVPLCAELFPPYPNPFNSTVTIEFRLADRQAVHIDVVDLKGRPVRRLAGRVLPAGSYRLAWDGRDERGREVPSGVYVVVLRGKTYSATRKICLLR